MSVTWKREWKAFAWIVATFLAFYILPAGSARFENGILEALRLARWYARQHVLLCLVPAFFIAGAISVFVGKSAVMRYLGPGASKVAAYGVASISGSILAVCSCTVLPLFAGIHRMGAGLGPATTFLYAGPAVNVLAIILTARILGPGLGVARAVGAVVFSVVIGLAMHAIFRRERREDVPAVAMPEDGADRPLWQQAVFVGAMVGVLVFANWAEAGQTRGAWHLIATARWWITAGFAALLAGLLVVWFDAGWRRVLVVAALVVAVTLALPGHATLAFAVGTVGLAGLTARRQDELGDWFEASWGFARQILPLLLLGVLAAGALLGRPGQEGWIPSAWVSGAVGGNSLAANLFAAVSGAFMYFATLTEVPILEGLIGNGMGQGPALALLLAGPAVSLPNMLVIRSVIGTRKTAVYIALVIVMATVSGWIYGALWGSAAGVRLH
jgi:hypothetical protein